MSGMTFPDDEGPSLPTWRPTDKVPVVYNDGADERCLAYMEWGFIPSWDHRLEQRGRIYNIRVETLLAGLEAGGTNRFRQSFVQSVLARRCLFPVSEFYEHSRRDGAMLRVLPPKGQEMLCIAGLYSQVQVSLGEHLATLGILTRPDSRFGRFPIVLDLGPEADAWLERASNRKPFLVSWLRQLGYTERKNYHLPQDKEKCAEPPPGQSLQTRLSLP